MRFPRRLLHAVLALTLLVAAMVAAPAEASDGAPAVGGLGPVTYTEGGPPVKVAPGITITGGGTFADGYIEFGIAGAGAEDRLFLPEGTEPDTTEGAITVIGSAVHLGLGGGASKQIGTVNATHDGQQGRPLRVDFSAALPNASFSEGVDGNGHPLGWTITEQHLTLGADWVPRTQGRAMGAFGGSAPSYTINGPDYSFTSDVPYGPSSTRSGWAWEGQQRALADQGTRTFDSAVVDGALRLFSSDVWCENTGANAYCSVFGPDAWSTQFEAKAGDDLAFDWRAANGNDDYEVYGYLVDVDSGTHTQLMYGRGLSQPWRTSAGTIPADGTYRFRFLSGSYDATGGRQTGASLYIDDVRVLSSDANAAVAQAVARLVHYEHTGQNPPSGITIGVETTSTGGTTTDEVATEVTLVDDAPTVAAVPDVVFTNTEGATVFATQTGTFDGDDPEGDPITWSVAGNVADPTTVGGTTYSHRVTGTLGTLHLDATTGKWAVVPDAAALDAAMSPASEEFTVTATANGLTGSATVTVAVAIQVSPPGAPTDLTATPGDSAVDLAWTAPTWTGGSPLTGYRIQRSLDGGDTWTTVVADTGDASTTRRITGLTNGTPVRFRVAATNANGTGAFSVPAATTPVTTPGAPTDLAAMPGPSEADLTWTAPADTGGSPITGYRVERSTDGATWTVAVTDTGSDATAITVAGLDNGVRTWFRVTAITAAGTGPASDPADTTPRTVPGAPTALAASPGDATVVLSWTAPSDDGGAPVTGYRIERSDDGGATWQVLDADTGTTTTSTTVTGLTNGTPVRFRVAAINAAGTGSMSPPLTTTALTVPGAPTITSVTAGNRVLVVAVSGPADDGGAPVTGFEHSTDGGLTWRTAPAPQDGQITVAPLDNGTTYPVRVRAVNAAGAGAASNEVPGTPVRAPVLPADPSTPPAPTGTGVLLVDGRPRTVTVTAPSPMTGDLGTPAGTLRFSDGTFSVDLLGVDADGDPLELDTEGRLVIVAGAFADVSGEGFRPGSTADVWLMSDPIHLGDVAVGADGAFADRLPIPAGIAPGPHTIQLNGVAADGSVRTLSVGVVVRAAAVTPAVGRPSAAPRQPAALAFTGGGGSGLPTIGMGLLVVGVLLLVPSRRRRLSPR